MLRLFLAVFMVAAHAALAAGEDPLSIPPVRNYRDIRIEKDDIPFITCAVCKRLVRQLASQAQARRKSKIHESDYVDMMKNVCDPLEEEGFWIMSLDVVEYPDKLDLKRMNVPGHCEEDCKTVATACQEIVDNADVEIAEALYLNRTNTTPESICTSFQLRTMPGGCGSKYPVLPRSRSKNGNVFRPKTKADFAREQKAAEMLLKGGLDEGFGDSLGDDSQLGATEGFAQEEL
jgi:hypothetical protein